MADRQQNIRIKFITDTKDLDKLKGVAAQAQASTDKLKQSAGELGTKFSEGARKSVQSLEAMNLQLARLKAQISLTTDPKLITQLSNQYKQLKVQVDATTKAYYQQAQALKVVQKDTQGLSSTLGQVTSAVKLFIAAGLVREAVTAGLEMAKLAGNIEGVKRAFDRLPGSLVLLQDLRDATQGTVTDFELMQRSLQAKNFRIPLQQLASLFEFATVRAQQTGQSVDYLINSIVFGLGFQSIRRLDNVGISAAELRDVMKELGVSLNEAFNIVVNREIQKMGGLIKTSATEVDILTKNFNELKAALSTRLTDSSWIKGLSEAMNGLRRLASTLPANFLRGLNPITGPNFFREWNRNVEELVRSERNLKTASEELKVVQQGLGETAREQSDAMIQEVIARRENIRLVESLIDKKKAEISLNDLQNKSNSETRVQYLKLRDQLNNELEGLRNRLQIDQLVVVELNKMLQELFKTSVPQLGLIEAKLAEIEDVSKAIEAAKSTQEIHDLNVELEKLNGELEDLRAFGTTKRQLIVNGQIRLVPVVSPKGESKTVAASPAEMTDQLIKDVQLLLDNAMLQNKIFKLLVPAKVVPIIPESEWDKFKGAVSENLGTIQDVALSQTEDLLNAQFQNEVEAFNAKIRLTKNFYDEQMILAGDNERRKTELRLKEEKEIQELTKKRANAEQKAAKAAIIVNTALGIIKAIATATTIYDGLVKAAIVAAEGASQYAIANSARYYAKGKVNIDGPGTGTSDSIKANISKGESVINAKSTSRSLKLLEGINAGKIDDRILSKLHITKTGIKSERFDDSNILKALRANQPVDIVGKASTVYEVHKAQDGFSKIWRTRTMGKPRR